MFYFIRSTHLTLTIENLSTETYQDAFISSLLLNISFFKFHHPTCGNIFQINSTFRITNYYDA